MLWILCIVAAIATASLISSLQPPLERWALKRTSASGQQCCQLIDELNRHPIAVAGPID